MSTARSSHRRKGFSFFTFISLLFLIASLSFGAIIFASSKTEGNLQEEKSSTNSHTNSLFSNFLDNTPFGFLKNNTKDLSNLNADPVSVFVVDDDGDSLDVIAGDGICADASDKCTLRAAIQESNAHTGVDEITFDLPIPTTIQLNLTPGELVITEPVIVTGPGARNLTISGNADTALGIFKINSTVTPAANISGITVAASGGRGITNDGNLNLTDVVVKQNGYGIYNSNILNVTRSLITNNTSSGIYLTSPSVVDISNTTITNNSSSDFGGGIYSLSPNVTLNNVTISNNSAVTSGGGIYYNNAAVGINVRNTIIAANSAAAGADIFSAIVTTGTFRSRGNNLIGKSDTNIGFINNTNNDLVGTTAAPVNASLGPLQNNGGPTDSRALLTGSIARNVGNNCVTDSTCAQNNPINALPNDQRGTGFPRSYEAAVDIGAFESFYPVPSITSFVPNGRGTGTGAFELIINGSNFVMDSVVKWNGQNRATTFVSNTQLKVQILATDVNTAGQYPIIVTNPLPGGGPSATVNFTVADCTYTINPLSSTPFTAVGGNGSVTVQALSGCAWTAAVSPAAASWVSITNGSSGTGNGTVQYSVATNNGPQRNGTITIAGQTFNITQNDGCTYTISPLNINFTAAGGTGSVTVTTSNQQCAWTSSIPPSTPEWFTINTNASGTGDKTLTYTVAANQGIQRSKNITIAGKIFAVSQDSGCTFTISPLTASVPVAGGTGAVSVTASSQQCQWTTIVPPSTPEWFTITSGASGTGDGTVAYTVAANTGTSRSKAVTIAGKTFTISQGSGCDFTISPLNMNFGASGGNGTITITTTNQQCPWSLTLPPSTPEWITITSPTSGTGNGTVAYTVAANNGPQRNKDITVAGKTFNVSQDSGCVYTISPLNMNFSAAGGTGTVTVTTNAGCVWSASVPPSTPEWITITNNASQTGSGTINYTVAANTGPSRNKDLTIAGKTFNISQDNGCVYTITPTSSALLPATAGNGTFAVTAGAGCTWTATATPSTPQWITVTSGAGNGNGTVAYTVAANNGPARSGTITIADKTFTVNQETGCTYTISPLSMNFTAAGGTGSVTVTTSNQQCAWTSSIPPSTPEWFTINTNASGTGDKTLTYTVAANTGPQRNKNITIAGKTFAVSQDSGCTFTISPLSMNFTATGGNGTVAVTASSQQCQWTTIVPPSTPEWFTITSGASGTGDGTVAYTVAANTGAQRNKNITIAGKTFAVSQDSGCVYTISPLNMSFPVTGGTGTVTVTANPGCGWTAVVAANASWITINSGASGTGNGTVAYTVAANNGPARSGDITIAGKTFTVSQGNGCDFTISPLNMNFSAAGGTGTVTVTNVNQLCTWIVQVPPSSPEWVTVTNGSGGTGNGTVAYTVAANNGPQRTKVVTIAGKTFTITQDSGCVFTITPTSMTFSANGGNGTVQLTVSNPLCSWNVSLGSNSQFITVTSPASGTGGATIAYTVAANTGAQRNGTINIADKLFTITQLSTLVTNLNDSGAGSLRDAIINANSAPGDDVIRIQQTLVGTITLTSGELIVNNNGKVDIIGPGADKVTISGNNASRIFYLNNAVFSLSDVTLTGGNGVGTDSSDNFKFGGAIYVNEGTLNLNRVNVTGNALSVPDLGPGRSNSTGGAIYINAGNNHRIQNSTVSNNSAITAGGVYNLSILLTAENSTFYGNNSSKNGGAFYTLGNIVMRNVTITKNQATLQGGGIYIGYGSIDMGNTIISGNIGPEISFSSGAISFAGKNMIGDAPGDSTNTINPITYQPTDILDTPPRLGALSTYGGSMPTVALTAGSPAINNGDDTVSNFATDQRGLSRIIGSASDIGAFEYNIAIEPSASALPDGSIGNNYGQALLASRITGAVTGEQFTYTIVEGSLPAGMNLFSNGVISGVPTSGGFYPFTVKATGSSDLMSGANKYTISIGCAYSINPQFTPVIAAGGNGTVTLTATPGCPWTAVSNNSWLSVTAGASGTGSGSIQFTAAANLGLPRTGTITIADKTFTVSQGNGCDITINPSNKSFSASAGTGSFDVATSDSQCTWSTSIPQTDSSWISVTSGSSGTGAGTVNYSIAPNTTIQRFGSINVGAKSFTITQAEGCSYSLSSTGGNIPIGGGTVSFNVTTNSICGWQATTSSTWFTITAGGGNSNGNGTVTISATANTGAARSGTVIVKGQPFNVSQAGTTASRTAFDFDGDGKADVSVFRPSNGLWYLLNSQSGFGYLQFGATGDKLVPADYDGDGKSDVAVFRGDTWYIQRTTLGFTNPQFGQAGDIAVPADYDADGKTDLAVYRPSTGTWFLQRSTAGFLGQQFGINGDIPMPGDFDGDGKADLALFRPSNGIWYIFGSTQGFYGVQFGATGDKLVPADYDGDGKVDLAVFRPSTATWFINRSQLGSTVVQFGISTDIPVPADYDGDGKADIGVYRNDTWFIQRSTAGFTGIQFGASVDSPIPNSFVR